MKNLKKHLQEKQKELKEKVEQYQQLQQALNQLNQDILRIDGSIKTLQELINKEKEVKNNK